MKIENIFIKNRENGKDILIDEIDNFIKRNIEFVLLDVRSTQEYNEVHLNRFNKYTAL